MRASPPKWCVRIAFRDKHDQVAAAMGRCCVLLRTLLDAIAAGLLIVLPGGGGTCLRPPPPAPAAARGGGGGGGFYVRACWAGIPQKRNTRPNPLVRLNLKP